MLNRDLFTNKVLFCILNREKEVPRVYVFLSKVLEMYDMGDYATIVDNRIMDSDEIDYLIENNHVIMDVFNHDLQLDETALRWFRPILEGYISHEQYNTFLEMIETAESLRVNTNIALTACQEMSIFELIKSAVNNVKKYRDAYPEQSKDLSHWYALELLSRTRIPKFLYYIKGLPDQIKMKLILGRLEKGLRQAFSLED